MASSCADAALAARSAARLISRARRRLVYVMPHMTEREAYLVLKGLSLSFFSVIYYRHHFVGAEFGEKLVDAQSATKQYCVLNITTHLVRVHLNE